MRKIYAIMGDHELKREEVKSYLENSTKPLKYTHGLGFRKPTINKIVISKEDAISKFENNSLCDITEHEGYIHINTFSSNDLL